MERQARLRLGRIMTLKHVDPQKIFTGMMVENSEATGASKTFAMAPQLKT